MKISNTKKTATLIIICLSVASIISMNSCVESKKIADKSGAQLWAENCQRCHNTPAPNTFFQEQWKTVGMHMQTRALLTNKERDKVVEFLQSN
jgi:nitrate/TMAO reductase-like tetraheme cytochrome c subunit